MRAWLKDGLVGRSLDVARGGWRNKREGITPKMRKKRCPGVGRGGRAGRKDCISRHKYQGKFEEGSSAEESSCHSPTGKRAKHLPLLFHTPWPLSATVLVSKLWWG